MVKSKRRSKGPKATPDHGNDSDDGTFGNLKFSKHSTYEPSGSEDEYTEQEKLLLENIPSRANRSQPKKYAIMDLPSDDDEDDSYGAVGPHSYEGGSDNDMDSDIEGKQVDEFGNLPDSRAWGKSRKNFYSTDYVDQDYGGFDEEDAEVADMEEQEARAIQQRLAAELDETDFTLDVFAQENVDQSKSKDAAELIKTDLSQLSSRQKLSLLQKEAPELIGIVTEFRGVMSDILKRLSPAMKLIQQDKVSCPDLVHYIRTKYYLANNYALNMGFYLLLRARRLPVAAHPVVKRLLQYRQLLLKLDPIERVASAKLDELLEAATNRPSSFEQKKNTITKTMKHHLNIVSSLETSSKSSAGKDFSMEMVSNGNLMKEMDQKGRKKSKTPADVNERVPWENTISDESIEEVPKENERDANDEEEPEGGESKRGITWEMAKNKGITARRKKEDRNPRVKHRNKFRKAKIRRKGQVREPRKELSRYGGELSGIKATVSKSIKLK